MNPNVCFITQIVNNSSSSTLQVATILVAMAPKILELATWFGE